LQAIALPLQSDLPYVASDHSSVAIMFLHFQRGETTQQAFFLVNCLASATARAAAGPKPGRASFTPS
jgi:hypothetical protein